MAAVITHGCNFDPSSAVGDRVGQPRLHMAIAAFLDVDFGFQDFKIHANFDG